MILAGKSILITGGTGYFGRALVKHLLAQPEGAAQAPARICIYSRGEAAQARMRSDLGDPPTCRWLIGDVRDRWRLERAMESVDAVVHAAALKRVEVGEYNPSEMVQTNVGGAQNVIDAAIDAGVEKVVALSSDKACEPLNCYGATKLVAEKLFLAANLIRPGQHLARHPNPVQFNVVRYGNVAGSTGSVIPTWRNAILTGAKLEVRNIEATRFWMTVQEAVDLILWSLERHAGGELAVPYLKSYRMGDLLAAMLGQERGVEAGTYSEAMVPGEKLHETMISIAEAGTFEHASSSHYWVSRGQNVGGIRDPLTSKLTHRMTVPALVEALKEIE